MISDHFTIFDGYATSHAGLVQSCSSKSDQFPSITFRSPDTIQREDAIAVIFLHQAIDAMDAMDAILQFAHVLGRTDRTLYESSMLQVAWRSHSPETEQAREIHVIYLTLSL